MRALPPCNAQNESEGIIQSTFSILWPGACDCKIWQSNFIVKSTNGFLLCLKIWRIKYEMYFGRSKVEIFDHLWLRCDVTLMCYVIRGRTQSNKRETTDHVMFVFNFSKNFTIVFSIICIFVTGINLPFGHEAFVAYH